MGYELAAVNDVKLEPLTKQRFGGGALHKNWKLPMLCNESAKVARAKKIIRNSSLKIIAAESLKDRAQKKLATLKGRYPKGA